MAGKEPVSAQPYNAAETRPLPTWPEAGGRLEGADFYWLATVRPDGRPHVAPVLAVWADGALHFVAGSSSRKARNLARASRCVITVDSGALHLVVEGEAAKVSDKATPHRVAEAYASKYGWRATVRDGAFYADGAPTAGPPPYDVYQVIPAIAFGFGQDESFSRSRWRFSRDSAWPQGAPTS